MFLEPTEKIGVKKEKNFFSSAIKKQILLPQNLLLLTNNGLQGQWEQKVSICL